MRTGSRIKLSGTVSATGLLPGDEKAIELIWRKVNDVALNNHHRTVLTILTQAYI